MKRKEVSIHEEKWISRKSCGRCILTKADAERAINALVDAVSGALVEGDKVALKGLGTFEVRERKARTGINPRTRETIEIPASKVPAFKASSTLKDAVNK